MSMSTAREGSVVTGTVVADVVVAEGAGVVREGPGSAVSQAANASNVTTAAASRWTVIPQYPP